MTGTAECPHDPEEFDRLLELATGAKSILEIGSRYGRTLRKLASVMSGGLVVSVDLPGGRWGERQSKPHLERAIEGLRASGYDARVFFGDSKDEGIIERVSELGPFDFIFIDGDHSYEGVKADWLNYGPLGKLVVFHDIHEDPWLGVWKLWEEIEGHKEAFIVKNSKMGLGIVRR